MATTRHGGRWTLEDRFVSAWHYLPVDVPPGASGLRVELDYQRGAAVLDLGCIGPAGFRGWSGSARRAFAVTPAAATPGYLPGELEPGTWQVVIGLHRVPDSGVDYRVTAEVSAVPGAILPDPARPGGSGGTGGAGVRPGGAGGAGAVGGRPPRRRLPAAPGRRWLAGDLHAHTVHSDGAVTVAELAFLAASRGLDYLAVTDHNTTSHHAELPAAAAASGVILVPGQEVTVEGGHAGALGDIGWVDFREGPDSWLAQTEARGGLLSVNHPIGGHVSWTLPMLRRPPLAEVWHWTWLDPHWTMPLAWWLAWDQAAVPVGGSDWHRPGSGAPPGSPTTWVECTDESTAGVLDGLRQGRTAISATRDDPVLLRVGGELAADGADGTVLAGPEGPKARVHGDRARFPGAPGCHRLVDPSGATLALTP